MLQVGRDGLECWDSTDWNVRMAQSGLWEWQAQVELSGKEGALQRRERKEKKTALVGQGVAPDHIFQAQSQAAWRMLIKTSALPGGCTEVLQIMVLPGASVQIN